MRVATVIYGVLSALGVVLGGWLLVVAIYTVRSAAGMGDGPGEGLIIGFVGTVLFICGWIGVGLTVTRARAKAKLDRPTSAAT